ncbi:MAG: thiosulfate oxidation carrier protein SoxY [Hyphomicrobiaceae bacterium]
MTKTLRGLSRRLNRREMVVGLATGGAAVCIAPMAAFATPAQVEEEVKKATGGKPLAEGKIKLDLPSIAENGLVVPLGFEVESPMTDKDYVKTLTFYAEGNPNPILAAFHFTPLLPKASGQIRIRLAGTQNIIAVAEMSDGKLFTAKKEVKVTIGGCGG